MENSLDSNRRTCIMIMGMHRSGTSAMAGMLHQMGFYLGEDLMPSTEFNEKGYFENLKVYELNERILESLKIRWDTSYLLNENYVEKPGSEFNYVLEIHSLIKSEFQNRQVFVIKDPRLSILFPFWSEAFELENIELKVITLFRNPVEVRKSLFHRDQFDFSKSNLLWLDYQLRAEEHTRGFDRVFINYRELIRKNSRTIEQLKAFLVFEFSRHAFNLNFIDAKLNHFKSDNDKVQSGVKLIDDLYSILNDLSQFGEVESKYDLIDILNSKFRSYSSFNGQIPFDYDNESTLVKEVIDKNIELRARLLKKEIECIELGRTTESLRDDHIVSEQKFESLKGHLKQVLAQNKDYQEKIDLLEDSLQLKEKSYLKLLKEQSLTDSYLHDVINKFSKENPVLFSDEISDKIMELENLLHSFQVKISHLDRVYNELKNSFSAKIGFIITKPVRYLYELLLRKSSLTEILIMFANYPSCFIRGFSRKNLQIFFRAVFRENPNLLVKNIRRYIIRISNLQDLKNTHPAHSFNIDESFILNESYLIVRGWAILDRENDKIELLVDNILVKEFTTGLIRADVAAVFGDSDRVVSSGFREKVKIENYSQDILDNIYIKFIIDGREFTQKVDLSVANNNGITINEQYSIFLEQKDANRADTKMIENEIAKFKFQPKISLITPVYNTDPGYLDLCINSVLDQIYENWELCLYDDASTNPETINILKKWEVVDDRIKIRYGKTNLHISCASNAAINESTGEFVGFLDHDDLLTCDALYEVVKSLNQEGEIDIIYSDEDKIDSNGFLSEPHFKSDFNLDLLLSHNYICHFTVVRKSIGDRIGWLRKGVEGAQDYDLLLRLLPITTKFFHIQKVLYHWRISPSSTSGNLSNKDYVGDASVKCLINYIKENNICGEICTGIFRGSWRLKREILETPLISIIIPFNDKVDVLKLCLESLMRKTNYSNYEILLISNNSRENETFEYLDSLKNRNCRIRIYEYNVPFNYSQINNWAIDRANGVYLLFLNNDTEILEGEWLSSMVEHIQREEVGAVGCKLLYPSETVQHAGVVIGLGGIAGHVHMCLDDYDNGYMGRANIVQDLSACTAACLLVKKTVFEKIGGFDEKNLRIAFNDVDLCLRIRELGLLVVYTPYAKLIHHESLSRGYEDTVLKHRRFQAEISYFRKRWAVLLEKGDPYYNRNLSLVKNDFSLDLDN